MTNYKHALLVMEKHNYPDDAKEIIIRTEEKILASEKANKIYDSMYRDYWIKKKNFDRFRDKVDALAEEIGEHKYTIHLVLLLNCTKPLLAEYKKKGISEDVYWNTILDLYSKGYECKENYGFWGTFVETWFMGFYNMTRFGLGRFQYEAQCEFGETYYNEFGVELFEDEPIIGMHIPSHQGPITYEYRLDSYKKAAEFFKAKFPKGKMIVECNSWLLYPDNLNIFNENSNVSDFLRDWEPLDIRRTYDFGDAWRVFGVEQEKRPLDKLTGTSGMQKAYMNWFAQGKKPGTAYCILIFDMETNEIITRCSREEYKKRYGY